MLVCFDAADYFYDDETGAQHLTAAAEHPRPDVSSPLFGTSRALVAWRNSPRMAGSGGESPYKSLLPGGILVVPCEASSLFAARPLSFDTHGYDDAYPHPSRSVEQRQ